MNTGTPGWRPPVIRQAAVVMLGLCVLAPLLLLALPRAGTSSSHNPAKLEAAMSALFGAVKAAPSGVRGPFTVGDLAPLAEPCARQKSYEGVPILQDLADNLNLLDGQLSALTASPNANGRLAGRYSLDIDSWMAGIRSGAVSCGHAAQALSIPGP